MMMMKNISTLTHKKNKYNTFLFILVMELYLYIFICHCLKDTYIPTVLKPALFMYLALSCIYYIQRLSR